VRSGVVMAAEGQTARVRAASGTVSVPVTRNENDSRPRAIIKTVWRASPTDVAIDVAIDVHGRASNETGLTHVRPTGRQTRGGRVARAIRPDPRSRQARGIALAEEMSRDDLPVVSFVDLFPTSRQFY